MGDCGWTCARAGSFGVYGRSAGAGRAVIVGLKCPEAASLRYSASAWELGWLVVRCCGDLGDGDIVMAVAYENEAVWFWKRKVEVLRR